MIIDGENQKLRVRFFSKSKIGFLNAKESEVHSSVPLKHYDSRDLGLICLVKKRKIRLRILSDLRIQSWIFFKCIWQILFLFARLNLPNAVIIIAKIFFDSDFPSLGFVVPKVSNFTSGEDSKPREKQVTLTFSYFLINSALLYHFLVYWLAHNKKMTGKSVFRDARTPEMTSQSFPISCFWSRGIVPQRKWNLTLLVHQNTGKGNR